VQEVVASIGRMEKVIKSWTENLKATDYLKDLGIDGRRILKSVSRK
jgi:hypothetical protein